MPRPKRFKGPKSPLTRSKYGQTVREAQNERLNDLRDKEKGDKLPDKIAPPGFVAAVKLANKKGT
jgi:hypothetical protein